MLEEEIKTSDNLFKYIIPNLKSNRQNIHIIFAAPHPIYGFMQRTNNDVYEEILNAHDQGKTTIIFNCTNESVLLNIIDKIHAIIKRFPDDKIFDFVFLSGAINVKTPYKEYCDKQKITRRLRIIETWFFENNFRLSYDEPQDFLREYQMYARKKLFLCYNNVPRLHRILLLEKILETNLFDRFYYSFMSDKNRLGWGIFDKEKFKNIHGILDLLPIKLGSASVNMNPTTVEHEDIYHFKNSLVSVVTETIFFTDRKFHVSKTLPGPIFFSEKTFKPMMMLHPFLLVSRPKSLNALRQRGYKTFDSIIDESYDDEEDDFKRLDKIVNEIKRLSELTDAGIKEFMIKVKPIVEHNKQHFLYNALPIAIE